jgi:CBS domain-containing protein
VLLLWAHLAAAAAPLVVTAAGRSSGDVVWFVGAPGLDPRVDDALVRRLGRRFAVRLVVVGPDATRSDVLEALGHVDPDGEAPDVVVAYGLGAALVADAGLAAPLQVWVAPVLDRPAEAPAQWSAFQDDPELARRWTGSTRALSAPPAADEAWAALPATTRGEGRLVAVFGEGDDLGAVESGVPVARRLGARIVRIGRGSLAPGDPKHIALLDARWAARRVARHVRKSLRETR